MTQPPKVQLLENLRYFDHDDTDFYLKGTEVKTLDFRHLRSYSIKSFLSTGRIQVVEGEVTIQIKDALVFIDSTGIYGKQGDKYFKRDMFLDKNVYCTEADLPAIIISKLNNNTAASQKEESEEGSKVETTEIDSNTDEKPDEIEQNSDKTEADTISSPEPDEEAKGTEEVPKPNFNTMFLDDLMKYAKEHNIEYEEGIKVNELRKLLEEQ